MTDKASPPPALWTKVRGPIIASPRMVELAEAINALLVAPIAVLPSSTEKPVLPFAIGISTEVEARIKPDASLNDLKRAIRAYARHRTYLLASAQPDAMRHDVDGKPVEPVNDDNRLTAMTAYTSIMNAIKLRKERELTQAAA